MSEYNYINDYERDETQKYEGIYSAEEIELNKKLYEECSKDVIDFSAVEDLLKQGADPNGATEVYGWGLLEHIYGEIVCKSQDSKSVNLPQLTELFLKYGMDLDNPKIPYDNENSINPMWDFAFITNENAIYALKMLLDKKLSVEGFAEFWDHAVSNLFVIECGDPEKDEFWNYTCTWTFKMLLLGASYDYILSADEGLQNFICCDYNTYDIHKFQNWNKFKYHFDTSRCEKHPELYKSILRIYDKETGVEVWKIGIGAAGRNILAELENKNILE